MADEPEKQALVGFPRSEPNFVQGLGDVTLAFSQLETVLKTGVTLLLENPSHGTPDHVAFAAVTAKMPFQAVLEVFEALYRVRRHLDSGSISAMEAVVREIASVQKQRNDVIHSLWFATEKPSVGQSLRFTLKGPFGLEMKERTTKPGELHKLADSIRQAVLKLIDLLSDYELSTFPNRKPIWPKMVEEERPPIAPQGGGGGGGNDPP